MPPMACVDVPALPLQLLLLDQPSWDSGPAAVVAEDKPQARLLWVNEAARRMGILPGHRYAAALALSGNLRAGVVSEERITAGIEALAELLRRYSPVVEPAWNMPGTFWVDVRGLEGLFDGPVDWGRQAHAALTDGGFEGRIILGWSRFGTHAVARGHGRASVVVLQMPEDEHKAARIVPLSRLGTDPRLRDDLHKLGVTTVGTFADLPAGGLKERFGEEAYRLHSLVREGSGLGLEAYLPEDPLTASCDLEYPVRDTERLVELWTTLTDPLLTRLCATDRLVSEVVIGCVLDAGGRVDMTLRPAEPTTTLAALEELVQLRFDAEHWKSGVVEMEVEIRVVRARAAQATLFADRPRRDLKAQARALARLRAEFGNRAVVRAEIRTGHLPEGRVSWTPTDHFPVAKARERHPVLVREIYTRPVRVAGKPRHHHDDGWLVLGADTGCVVRLFGPFVLSGGWWRREIHREYHWVETRSGRVLWAFHDRGKRAWFLQGELL